MNNLVFESFLQTPMPPQPTLLGMFMPFILIFVIFYFLLIRPQNKEKKKQDDMIKQLKKGDKIQTIGGILGTVAKVKETSIIIKLDENSTLEIKKEAIAALVGEGKESNKEHSKSPKSKEEVAEKTEPNSNETETKEENSKDEKENGKEN